MRRKMLLPHLKTAQDARAARTREALRQGMLKLLDLKPIEQITIQDICEVSEVGYTTYFRYHSTKESLLNSVAAEQMGQLVELSHSVASTSDTRSGAIALCAYVDEHRHLWTTLLTGGAAGVMRNEFIRLSRQISITEARPNAWPPIEAATILVVSSTIELLTWWLRDSPSLSVEQVAKILELAIITPTIDNPRTRNADLLTTGGAASIEANKTAAIAIVQGAFHGRLDRAALSDDAIWWMQGTRELPIDAFIDMNRKFREAHLAGAGRFEIHGITAEGDRVAIEAECFVPLKKGGAYNGTYHYLIRFRDDKACIVKEYCDTARARVAFFNGGN